MLTLLSIGLIAILPFIIMGLTIHCLMTTCSPKKGKLTTPMVDPKDIAAARIYRTSASSWLVETPAK